MPRRRPAVVRAAQCAGRACTREWALDLPPIDGLSRITSATIHAVEHRGLFYDIHHIKPGSTEEHLTTYKGFLRQHGRLELIASDCPACPGCQYMDVAVVRDALEAIAHMLPPPARAEFRRLLGRLDREFRRRTWHDPDPSRWIGWRGQLKPWWHRRVYEQL